MVYAYRMDKRTLQQAIITSRSKFLDEDYRARDFGFSFMKGKATVITGARRSGKTSMLRNFAYNLAADGLDAKRICYLHFFDDMFAEEHVTVSQIADAYFSMYPELYHDSNVYFILDEIEMLHSWGAGISGLLDSHPANVLITGSSGKIHSLPDRLRCPAVPLYLHPSHKHDRETIFPAAVRFLRLQYATGSFQQGFPSFCNHTSLQLSISYRTVPPFTHWIYRRKHGNTRWKPAFSRGFPPPPPCHPS